jgi:hypothetical protein
MIKFLSTTIGILVVDVGFLFYLLSNSNFTPLDSTGSYISLNIFVLFLILFVALCCLLILIIWGLRKIFLKPEEELRNIKLSIIYGVVLALGILGAYLLHFFHILSFFWGLGILLVGIILIFVI